MSQNKTPDFSRFFQKPSSDSFNQPSLKHNPKQKNRSILKVTLLLLLFISTMLVLLFGLRNKPFLNSTSKIDRGLVNDADKLPETVVK